MEEPPLLGSLLGGSEPTGDWNVRAVIGETTSGAVSSLLLPLGALVKKFGKGVVK